MLRKLARTPLFTAVSVLTLALGIGGNTAIFSVVNGVLLKPLPFEDPETLVGVWHTAPGLGFDEVDQSPATYFTYWEESRTFEDIGMWDNSQVSITGLEEPEELEVMWVTDGTFPILRVQAAIGRVFTREDDSPGTPETVILGHGYWQARFGGDPGVLGKTLRIDGKPREIIGVMPANLRFLRFDPAVYLPFQWNRSEVFMGNFSYQALASYCSRASPSASWVDSGDWCLLTAASDSWLSWAPIAYRDSMRSRSTHWFCCLPLGSRSAPDCFWDSSPSSSSEASTSYRPCRKEAVGEAKARSGTGHGAFWSSHKLRLR